MNRWRYEGFSLMELMVTLGISSLVIYFTVNVLSENFKTKKDLEKNEETREAFDQSLRIKDNNHSQINAHGERTCNSLGLKYFVVNGKRECRVLKHTSCPNANPCYVTVKDALCDLERRARVPAPKFCYQ